MIALVYYDCSPNSSSPLGYYEPNFLEQLRMAQPAVKPAESLTPAQIPGRGRIYDSIIDTIGNTPIVRLNKIAKEKGVKANLLAKLEFFNPIASVKDRIGVSMIDALERDGRIKPGATLIEP